MSFAESFPPVPAVRVADDREYATLFVESRDGVYRFAWFLVGDGGVAEEITAEVFARVLPKWRRGQVLDPVSYLRRAVLNEVRSRYRRRGHEKRALSRAAEAGRRAVEGVDRVELREPLLAALQQLPVRQRVVVVLRFHDDLSEAEVARIVGSPVGTVKAQASRGLVALRALMENDDEF